MKKKFIKTILCLFSIFSLTILLAGCSLFRGGGDAYSGYSCRESLLHFYSYCADKNFTKEELEAKVQTCEKDLATKVCDKEQADLLWCLGRTAPGIYSSNVGGYSIGVFFGNGSTSDGCDCSTYSGALKECQMKVGMGEKAPEPIKANNSVRKYNSEAVNWTEKSTAMAREKNWSEMIRTASAAIASDPSYPEAYVNRSWAYLEKGFPEKALEDCNKALSLDSNNPGRSITGACFTYVRAKRTRPEMIF